MSEKKQNILICPLEWGLGHSARMMPVAARLRDMKNNIFIGAGEIHLSFFRNEMQGLSFINFPGFKPAYSKHLPQYVSLFLQIPFLLYHSVREHFRLKKIIREYSVDIVISDNRFGLWNRNVKTVYITHMPVIPFPQALSFLEFTGILLHRAIIKKYTYCFIPDLPGKINLSGRLSHGVKLHINVRFIGILSRFSEMNSTTDETLKKFRHNTVILSGPEPQREILKQKLIDILKDKEPLSVFFEGKPEEEEKSISLNNIIFYTHLASSGMAELIKGSETIVTRSGYTTVMELISLKCSALLIPTPGQTEQEYLARYLEEKGWFTTLLQKDLNENISLPHNKSLDTDEILVQSEALLDKALKELSE
jgi:spore coat polysaccharide biosynthesis predicted glycosyltransferase SpsG